MVSRAPRPAAAVPAEPNEAIEGCVISAHRRHFVVDLGGGETLSCVLKGRNATLACGDQVTVTRVTGGGVVDAVLPRTSLLFRSDAYKEKLIAANVDQVIGVVAPDLSLDLELVNRWAVAASAEGCRFVIAANKSDQSGFATLAARLEPFAVLGYNVVAVSATCDIAPLAPWFARRRSVLIGQSGMGKSTILNAIAPLACARTAAVSDSLNTGRHTTTHSTLYALGNAARDGWVVDSPGMKAFGLAHLPPDAIVAAFTEFSPYLGGCRFRDCRHDREPDCALRAAVAQGKAAPYRLALLRSLVNESEQSRKPGR